MELIFALLVSAAMLALAVVVARKFRGFHQQALARVASGSEMAALPDGAVEYADRGAGPVLLSIHGAGGGFDHGLFFADELMGGGFRLISPSRFGYLRTGTPAAGVDAPDGGIAAQADAHAALLDHLGLERVVVMGLSAGARSAAALAIRHPEKVRALVLIVPALDAPHSPVATDPSGGSRLVFAVVKAGGDFFWWLISALGPTMLIRFVGVRPALLEAAGAAERARVLAIAAAIAPVSARVAGIRLDSACPHPVLPLERITAPTLIVSARDDLFNTLPAAEVAAARIPGARLIAYDTGGHLLVGRAGQTRAAVRAFLEKNAA
ncbi:alpha/beta hydrolase [Xanthobacter sp.]|uniref:alpha/beta fold hydrolase n=1 Tax=Xanthobacter sp. TaxID=35809 RepID=UPI0025EB660B|nr:alpha/beta hydrolase [Xanthobacter sp.]